MSNLRNTPVPCHYIFYEALSYVNKLTSLDKFKKWSSHSVDFRGQGPFDIESVKVTPV